MSTENPLDMAIRDLRSLLTNLEELRHGGIDKMPADCSLTEALQCFRANLPIGKVTLTLAWEDTFSATAAEWQLWDGEKTHLSPSLSGLLRVYCAQGRQGDTTESLDLILRNQEYHNHGEAKTV